MLKIKDLNLYYGKKCILENLNHDFTHKITAIIGPSGSGKSSLIHSLSNLNRFIPEFKITGDIFYQDKKLEKNNSAIGLVFQKPTPFPVSISKNLTIVLEQHKHIPKNEYSIRVETILKKVGLWNDVHVGLNQNALKLSGGQQQKLCIARALLLNPKILMLDEPCSSLDPISTQQIENLLVELSHEMQIIIVTHHLKQAKRISQHVLVLGPKEKVNVLIESGDTYHIFQTPQTTFTKNYFEFE
jgi:phosphate transport system ATP-binding protein